MCKIGYTGVGTSIWYKTSQHRLKTILMRKLGKILYREAEILMHALHTRVRHRGAVPPKMKKPKPIKFSLNGHEKPDLNSEFRHDSVKFPERIAIYVLQAKPAWVAGLSPY